ncbi:beta-galactoside-binding lectin-like [Hypomesus transpacificus]|uniref:beta-galactoside-binding lectin-like n=1 Tax=Hypomesus transpacificus TaxID=137520 RepID=UPI001F0797AA|nr:beta-galactoside-binding lectin-like [Hypomesus transpacificus]
MSEITEVRNFSFKVGQVLNVTGVPTSRFSINVGHSEDDIALHVDVRFDHGNSNEVVFNSCHSGTWHKDHILAKSFPFNYDKNYKVSITFTKEKFFVTLPDKSVTDFPNRHGYEMYNLIFLKAKVKVHGIEIIDQSG